jgi:hypothetical protein
MKLTVNDLRDRTEVAETMAGFDQPIDKDTRQYLKETGLDDAQPVGCMEWIWWQWLLGAPQKKIHMRVEAFVERGMEMQRISPHLHHRPAHDLYLLHCAIFASSEAQLHELAEQVVDGGRLREAETAQRWRALRERLVRNGETLDPWRPQGSGATG